MRESYHPGKVEIGPQFSTQVFSEITPGLIVDPYIADGENGMSMYVGNSILSIFVGSNLDVALVV
jgi:hypothetical protein